MSYQLANRFANQEKHSAMMSVPALPKLRIPLRGRILANSDELICNPIGGLQACARSIHAPLESTNPKIANAEGIETFVKASYSWRIHGARVCKQTRPHPRARPM